MTTQEYAIDTLPELPLEPLELAGKLDHAGTAPVLTIKPHKVPAPEPPVKPTGLPSKSAVHYRKYLTQVLYPVVVCYPHNELLDRVRWQSSCVEENERDIEVIAKHARYYKLTSYNGVELPLPYLCRIEYGPWSAVATERESCYDGVPNEWKLLVGSVPDLVLIWYGTWYDIPSYPLLYVIMGDLYLVTETSMCCPGFQWCATTNCCIPVTVECEGPIPV